MIASMMRAVLILALSLSPLTAAAQSDEPAFEPDSSLMDYATVSAKYTQPARRTPASVFVLSREEISQAGYRSVGEALAAVPGFFVSYDLQNYHAGVRGIFGGARSGSRSLKILIDGRPATFTTSGTYFLGPEFIPMQLVERIEIMRGPASSLYGAGALVGAINVVTRRRSFEGQTTVGSEVELSGAALGQRVGGAELGVDITGGRYFALLGAVGSYEDRSGLAIPSDSPFAGDFPGVKSQGDIARPRGFFGTFQSSIAGGRLAALVMGQVNDRAAEFHDLGPLTHRSRQSLQNYNARLSFERAVGVGFIVRTSAGLSSGRPADGDQFDVDPDATTLKRRRFSSDEYTGVLEVLREIGTGGLILVGADTSLIHEQPAQVITFDTTSGSSTLGPKPAAQEIMNFAGYGQALVPIGTRVQLAGGLRYDVNDVISDSLSGRLGVVVAVTDRLSGKLLVGRSYKAPSPEQLYGVPLANGDVYGVPDLPAQTLDSAEGVVDLFVLPSLLMSGSVFYNVSSDALVYLLRAGDLQATSFDATTLGGELLVRYSSHFERGSSAAVSTSVSLQDTRTDQSTVGGFSDKSVPDNEAFPQLVSAVRGNVFLAPLKLNVNAGVRYVGERVPSQSNLRSAGTTNMLEPSYTLPAYVLVDAGLAASTVRVGSLRTQMSVKVENLLDSQYSEIGFGGVDVPSVGRTVWLKLKVSR